MLAMGDRGPSSTGCVLLHGWRSWPRRPQQCSGLEQPVKSDGIRSHVLGCRVYPSFSYPRKTAPETWVALENKGSTYRHKVAVAAGLYFLTGLFLYKGVHNFLKLILAQFSFEGFVIWFFFFLILWRETVPTASYFWQILLSAFKSPFA